MTKNADLPIMPITHDGFPSGLKGVTDSDAEDLCIGLTKREEFVARYVAAILSSKYIKDFRDESTETDMMDAIVDVAMRYVDATFRGLERTKND